MGERNTIIVVALVVFIALTAAFSGVGFYYMLETEDLEATKAKIQGLQGKEAESETGKLKQRIDATKAEIDKTQKSIDDLNAEAKLIVDKEFPVAATNIKNSETTAAADHAAREKADTARIDAAKNDTNEIAQAYDNLRQKTKKDDEALAAEQAKLQEAQIKLLQDKALDVGKAKNVQKEVTEFKVELDTLKAKLARMQERRAHLFDLKEDGRLIAAEPETNLAVINLGASSGVRPGMVFDVFEIKKDGKKVRKGKLRLQRVESQQSMATILAPQRAPKVCKQCGWSTTDPTLLYCVYCKFGDTGDPKEYKDVVRLQDSSREMEVVATDFLNPVSKGDYVSSPFYLGGKNRKPFVFAVAGRPAGHSRQEMGKFLKENGCSLAEAITVDTDFVVVGVGPAVEGELKNARELGASLIRERDLFEFFGRLGAGSDVPINETAMK